MWERKKISFAVLVMIILTYGWLVPEAVAQTKSSVPKPQNKLVLGEGAVRDLILLMEPDKNGKISKQEWLRFMGEAFDRLDPKKTGELNLKELPRREPATHVRYSDLGK